MAVYLPTIASVKACPCLGMPSADVDYLEGQEPGYILATARALQSEIDGQLSKKYPVPYAEPIPTVLLGWLGALLTPFLYQKRGTPLGDTDQQRMVDDANRARAMIAQAADEVSGKWGLPISDANAESAAKQNVVFYDSQQSPWTWTDEQSDGRAR